MTESGRQIPKENYPGVFENSGRSSNRLSQYAERLGLDIEALKGKSILDVGSGYSLFGVEAAKLGLDVVSVDPKTPFDPLPPTMSFQEQEDYRQRVEGGYILRAYAQNMPFEAESFDVVLALQSVPLYLPKDDSIRDNVVAEMLRVLAPGGEMRVFPAGDKPEESEGYVPAATLSWLEEMGYQTKFEPVGVLQRLVVVKPLVKEDLQP